MRFPRTRAGAFAGAARAQEPAAGEDPYVRLAVTRAKAEVAIRDLAPLCDERRAGWAAAQQATDETWERIAAAYDRLAQKEEQKGEDARDQKLLDQIQQKREQKETDWRAFQKNRDEQRQRYEECMVGCQSLSEIFDGMADLERRWKQAKLDLSVLESLYVSLEKRALDLHQKAQKALEEQHAGFQQWQTALKDAAAT